MPDHSRHMEPCRTETGDAPNATDCWEHNCRFSALSDQLFYLNGLGQVSSPHSTAAAANPHPFT